MRAIPRNGDYNSIASPDVHRRRHLYRRDIESRETLMISSATSRIAGVIASVMVLAAGCGDSNSDRAGGTRTAEPVVLTMAQISDRPPEQLVAWADEVAARSDGTLRIEYSNNWRNGETDFEVGTIEDVQAGKADLAWVGARAFDRVGVATLQPLLAPLLVDSHDLQGAVFEAGLPTQMLAGLEKLDVVGLGVLPGPMRKVMGVNGPFVRPTDFEGAVVGIQGSGVAAQTMKVLGATPQDLPAGAALGGLDAMEQQLASILGNNYALEGAHFVTVNLNMWPRPLVMFMNTKRFESLSSDQQTALRDAAGAAVDDALVASRAEDTDAISQLCADGMTLTVASDADLAALRTALEPVYQQIAADAANRAWLDEIVALKNKVGVPPDTAECPAPQPTAPETTEGSGTDEFPEGSFEATMIAEDYNAIGLEGNDIGTFTFIVDAGTITIVEPGGNIGFRGSYTVFRDRIEVSGDATVTAKWSFDGEHLTFTEVTPAHSPFEVAWESHPWTLVAPPDKPASGAFPEGTFETTITGDDWQKRCGTEPSGFVETREDVTFAGGNLEQWNTSKGGRRELGFRATYTVFRDRVEFDELGADAPLSFHWTFDGSTLVLSGLEDDHGECAHHVVWETNPWTFAKPTVTSGG
jgi:TRAP-type C4-dicarboxylate transport system substrate-binding protein